MSVQEERIGVDVCLRIHKRNGTDASISYTRLSSRSNALSSSYRSEGYHSALGVQVDRRLAVYTKSSCLTTPL